MVTQFDEIGPEFTDNDGKPINVDQELAIEASLHKQEPVSSDVHVSYK